MQVVVLTTGFGLGDGMASLASKAGPADSAGVVKAVILSSSDRA